MSEISDVFKDLAKRFNKGNVKAARTFYFSWATTRSGRSPSRQRRSR